jgi:hypothetical protein
VDNVQTKSIASPKVVNPYIKKKKQVISLKEKWKNNVQSKHKREFICFSCQELDHYALECQSKTIMILRNDEEVESAIDEFECESTP